MTEPRSLRDVTPITKAPKKKRRTVATSPALAKTRATELHSLIVRSKAVCERCGYECPVDSIRATGPGWLNYWTGLLDAAYAALDKEAGE